MSTSIDHGEHMVNIAVHYGCKVQLSVCISGWWGCWFGKAMLPTCIWLFVCLFDYLCVSVFSVCLSVCLARMSLEMLVWASNCCLFWQWLCVWLSVFLLVCVSGEDKLFVFLLACLSLGLVRMSIEPRGVGWRPIAGHSVCDCLGGRGSDPISRWQPGRRSLWYNTPRAPRDYTPQTQTNGQTEPPLLLFNAAQGMSKFYTGHSLLSEKAIFKTMAFSA